MTKRSFKALAAGIGAALALGLPGMAAATDLTKFNTIFDTNFASAGIGGMRGQGTGNVTLTGVSGTVTHAYLYWHGPSDVSATGTGNSAVTFAGTDITGTFLGVSSDNCWGFENSLAYRADVTSLVSGNGVFALTNFTKGDVEVNGASLIVFFDDGDASNNRDVVLFNGNDSNIENSFDALGWNITLAGITYESGTAQAQFHVSDGQAFDDDAITANSTIIAPSGAVFDGNTVPSAGGPNTNGFLWDIRNFNVTSLLTPGNNSLNIRSGQNSDCLSCILIAIDLPAGAAPPTGVPEPGSLALLGLGLAGLAASRRRKTA